MDVHCPLLSSPKSLKSTIVLHRRKGVGWIASSRSHWYPALAHKHNVDTPGFLGHFLGGTSGDPAETLKTSWLGSVLSCWSEGLPDSASSNRSERSGSATLCWSEGSGSAASFQRVVEFFLDRGMWFLRLCFSIYPSLWLWWKTRFGCLLFH